MRGNAVNGHGEGGAGRRAGMRVNDRVKHGSGAACSPWHILPGSRCNFYQNTLQRLLNKRNQLFFDSNRHLPHRQTVGAQHNGAGYQSVFDPSMSDTQFDYIIIGGGTAGALLCNRLSASGRYRVLLVEAGRKRRLPLDPHPCGLPVLHWQPRTDWLYHTEPDAGLNGRTLRYPRGKTLGGCSSINGMIYMRGQSRDYDQWAQLTGDDSWRWDNVLPTSAATKTTGGWTSRGRQ